MYLKTPKEAMASTPLWLNLCLTLLMLGCVVLSFWVFRRYVLKGLRYKRGNYWGIPIFLLIGGAMILPVRGGVNLAPLNSSAVFYHAENMYANQAAVNAVWNFIYELMHMKNLDKKYNYLPEQEVAQVVDSLMHTGTDSRSDAEFESAGQRGSTVYEYLCYGVAFRPRNGRCNQCRSFTSCRCYDQVSQ